VKSSVYNTVVIFFTTNCIRISGVWDWTCSNSNWHCLWNPDITLNIFYQCKYSIFHGDDSTYLHLFTEWVQYLYHQLGDNPLVQMTMEILSVWLYQGTYPFYYSIYMIQHEETVIWYIWDRITINYDQGEYKNTYIICLVEDLECSPNQWDDNTHILDIDYIPELERSTYTVNVCVCLLSCCNCINCVYICNRCNC